MNCERIQELILTDYLDGSIAVNVRREFDDHLARCPQCLQFARTVKETVVENFKDVKRPMPPEHVWSRIEETIREENVPAVIGTPAWLENLKSVFAFPKPVLVLAAVLVIFVAGGSLQQIRPKQQSFNESSVEYLASLVGSAGDLSSSDSSDFGTDVELVFL